MAVNIGAAYDSNLKTKIYSLTASVGYELTNRIGAFTEYFSNYTNEFSPQHNLDAGIVYLIKKNIQIDVSLGTIIVSDDTDFFGVVGFSVRLPK